MNTIYHNCKCLALLLCLLTGLPFTGMAQTEQFEMVIEKTDGTEISFRITDDYPQLYYQYGGEDGVNTLEIQMADNNTSIPCPEVKRLYTREAKAIPGDITGSGSVDVQDATIVVNYILGAQSGDYDFSLADMNNDGEVDVFDVQAIINVILSNTPQSAPSRRASQHDNEYVCVTADGNDLLFGIENAARYTSFQFDVEVPDGVNLLGVDWKNTTNHTLKFTKIGENQYRIVALSLESASLPAVDNALLRLHLSGSGNGEITVDHVLFVTPQGNAAYFYGNSLNMATGIQGITFTPSEQIFDISGRQLNVKREQLGKGVYIINHKKVVIK